MKLINTLTFMTWIVILLVACGGTSGDPLNNTSWELYSMGEYSPIAGSRLTIRFEEGQVSGNGGCNSYGGEYRVNGDRLKLEKLMSTLMACADPAIMEQETIFMQVLGEAQRFDIVDGRLQMYASGGEALTFVPAK